jgi:uncharacterized phage-associated protein
MEREMTSKLVGFRAEKAAQFSALLIQRSDGQIDKLKLIKMLYLAERESVMERGRPIFYDEYYSLEHGPICSNSLNALNGHADDDVWSEYIVVADKKNILASKRKNREEMNQISKSDFSILESVWNKFGWMTTSQVRNWTHKNCGEYVEVGPGSRLPITYESLYKELGYQEAAQMAAHIAEYRNSEAAVAA